MNIRPHRGRTVHYRSKRNPNKTFCLLYNITKHWYETEKDVNCFFCKKKAEREGDPTKDKYIYYTNAYGNKKFARYDEIMPCGHRAINLDNFGHCKLCEEEAKPLPPSPSGDKDEQ